MRNDNRCFGYSIALYALFFISMVGYSSAYADSMKQMIVRAIEMDGEVVRGELTGDIAQYVRAHTRSQQAIKVTTKLVSSFETEGCGRVQIQFHQDTPLDSQNKVMQFPMEINYCVDGSIPVPKVRG